MRLHFCGSLSIDLVSGPKVLSRHCRKGFNLCWPKDQTNVFCLVDRRHFHHNLYCLQEIAICWTPMSDKTCWAWCCPRNMQPVCLCSETLDFMHVPVRQSGDSVPFTLWILLLISAACGLTIGKCWPYNPEPVLSFTSTFQCCQFHFFTILMKPLLSFRQTIKQSTSSFLHNLHIVQGNASKEFHQTVTALHHHHSWWFFPSLILTWAYVKWRHLRQ